MPDTKMSSQAATGGNPRKVEVTPQWQTGKVNLRERNEYMFGNELISDVKFNVGKVFSFLYFSKI